MTATAEPETAEPPTIAEHLAKWDRFIWRIAKRAAARSAERFTLDAEDVHQLIVLEVLRLQHNWNPARGAFSTWVSWIARQTLGRLLEHRKHHTVPAMSLSHRCQGARYRNGENAELAELLPASENTPDPVEEAARRENVERLRAALATLPAEEREAVQRRFFAHGDSYAIRADLQLVTAAIQKLREALTTTSAA